MNVSPFSSNPSTSYISGIHGQRQGPKCRDVPPAFNNKTDKSKRSKSSSSLTQHTISGFNEKLLQK